MRGHLVQSCAIVAQIASSHWASPVTPLHAKQFFILYVVEQFGIMILCRTFAMGSVLVRAHAAELIPTNDTFLGATDACRVAATAL